MTKHNKGLKANKSKSVLDSPAIQRDKSTNVRITPELIAGIKEYVSLDHLDDFPAATRKLIRVGLQHEHNRLLGMVH